MDKQQAIDLINTQIKELNSNNKDYDIVKRETRVMIENTFGKDSGQLKEFEQAEPWVPFYTPASYNHKAAEKRNRENFSKLLESFINDIEKYGFKGIDKLNSPVPIANSKKVFIVHGHNDVNKKAAALLVNQLELEPIILDEQANKGRTIIEKFEEHSDVAFAIVLLTADDEGKACNEATLNPRARQNVIFELGFFVGKLGRERVCTLYEEGVEIPSDFTGVVYVLLDKHCAWKTELAKEMQAAGLPVDLNKL